jgi:hypothetical protein
MRGWLLWAVVSAVAVASACGDDADGVASNVGGGTSDSGSDSASAYTLRIEPKSTSATVTKGQPPPSVAFRAFAKHATSGNEQEVTTDASWSLSMTSLGSFNSPGTLALSEAGGTATITATWSGASATSDLTVKLTGDVFGPGTDVSTKAGFDSATVDPNPANAPLLEYPEDGAVLPGNLPAIEAQWTQAADNSVYRVRVRSGAVLDLSFYTAARELEFPSSDWKAISAASPDQDVELVVEGLGSGMLRASAPRTIVPSADQIDESVIYVWLSSKGSFAVLDVINQLESALPTNSPALAPGQPCSGCHRVSRDGKRFSYSFSGSNFQIGTLVYDDASKSFSEKIAPAAGVRGTYAAFNPLESTTRPAMLLSVPDDVAQNTAGNVALRVVDPDDNQTLPSDIDQMIAALPSATGQHTLMPDWSASGDFVVFTAYPGSQHFVREVGDDVTLGSIVQASVSYDAATQSFKFGAPEVLVQTPSSDPDSGENNLLPAISPDGAAVAFTRTDGWWSLKTQISLLNLTGRISLVRRSDGTVFELAGGTNGPAKDWSSTWPQWAPSIGSRYLWLAYASERPYGHRLTSASPENQSCTLVQGQKQCKHLWIMAIDKQALASGSVDPSRAPFWVPGQVLAQQYVSPFWTKAVALVPR